MFDRKNNIRKTLNLSILSLVGLVAVVIYLQVQSESNNVKPEIFNLPDITSSQVISSSQFFGQVVFVDIWAVWCIPCRELLPHAQQLANLYEKDGLRVIGINEDTKIEKISEYLSSLGISFQQLSDKQGQFMMDQSIVALPSMILIDRMGKIRYQQTGYSLEDSDIIESKIVALLSEH